MNETAATPRIPRPTITATTIRMILRALLLCGTAVVVATGEEGTADDALPAGWVAPHLVQNLAPPSRVAPQELQNAIKSPRLQSNLHDGGVYRSSIDDKRPLRI